MGLPDNHDILTTFREIIFARDTVIIDTVNEETIVSYGGFGKTMCVSFVVNSGTAPLANNQLINLYIDGVLVQSDYVSMLIIKGIHGDFFPLGIFYENLPDTIVFSVVRDLHFNSNITVTYQKTGVGNISIIYEASLVLL